MINLRDYQDAVFRLAIVEINKNLLLNLISRLALFLPTGGGKSVVIAKFAEVLKGRTLILTNRKEILKQNKKWLGDKCGILTADLDDVLPNHTVVIAMVETLNSRIKNYGDDYLGHFDNIIIDEAHINVYKKVYNKYDYKVLIGLTATPVYNKKVRKTVDGIKYQRDLVFQDYYDKIIQGTSTQELIDKGWLNQEFNVVLQKGVTDQLKSSKTNPDGYTIESLDAQYTNSASIKILKQSYLKYGVGKKTLIFNPSTKVSDFVYEALKPICKNIRKFDTRSGKGKREEIVKWYSETPDAVLINVNVFTTGFDEPDIECVILNRATKSLSLYHQMVGRGSRLSKNIPKEYFTVIDLGDNIYTHGAWSSNIDWMDYFYKTDFKPVRSLSIINTWDCLKCGNINPTAQFTCNCGNTIEDNKLVQTEKVNVKTRAGVLVAVNKIPNPSGYKIVEYTKSKKKGAAFAFNLAENKIINLFKHYKTEKEFFIKNKDRFIKRIDEIYNPIYFAIIKSDLKGANRTMKVLKDRLYKKIDDIWSL